MFEVCHMETPILGPQHLNNLTIHTKTLERGASPFDFKPILKIPKERWVYLNYWYVLYESAERPLIRLWAHDTQINTSLYPKSTKNSRSEERGTLAQLLSCIIGHFAIKIIFLHLLGNIVPYLCIINFIYIFYINYLQ